LSRRSRPAVCVGNCGVDGGDCLIQVFTGCGKVVSVGRCSLIERIDLVDDRDNLLVNVFLCGTTEVQE